jgi:hypothetical protein
MLDPEADLVNLAFEDLWAHDPEVGKIPAPSIAVVRGG